MDETEGQPTADACPHRVFFRRKMLQVSDDSLQHRFDARMARRGRGASGLRNLGEFHTWSEDDLVCSPEGCRGRILEGWWLVGAGLRSEWRRNTTQHKHD